MHGSFVCRQLQFIIESSSSREATGYDDKEGGFRADESSEQGEREGEKVRGRAAGDSQNIWRQNTSCFSMLSSLYMYTTPQTFAGKKDIFIAPPRRGMTK